MAIISKTFTFSSGTVIVASEHNSNFDGIFNEFNGNIDNANIKASAAIVDTKLAQITTINKVSSTAITGTLLDAVLGGAVLTGSNSTITAITGLTTPLAVNQGGTASTTANVALNTLLPSQAGNSGKYLTTNATDTSWSTVSISNSNYAIVTGSNATTTSTSLVNVTGLSIALATGSTYEFKAVLSTASSSSAGNRYGINYSVAGGAIEGQNYGTTTGTTAFIGQRMLAFNTITGVYNSVADDGIIIIEGVVTTGSSAGNLTVQHLKVTSGTATVYINSFLKVTKIP